MQVTAIQLQEKNKERFSVYVDGSYSFSLSSWQLATSQLRIGKELSAEEVAGFKHQSEFGKLYDRTLNWLLRRPHSERELRDYLYKRTDDAAVRDDIINRIKDKNLVDDRRFAEWWADEQRRLKYRSSREIRAQLRAKGVAQELIDAALQQTGKGEDEALADLVAKKRRLARYRDDEKLMAFLARKGFSYEQIRTALDSPQDA